MSLYDPIPTIPNDVVDLHDALVTLAKAPTDANASFGPHDALGPKRIEAVWRGAYIVAHWMAREVGATTDEFHAAVGAVFARLGEMSGRIAILDLDAFVQGVDLHALLDDALAEPSMRATFGDQALAIIDDERFATLSDQDQDWLRGVVTFAMLGPTDA